MKIKLLTARVSHQGGTESLQQPGDVIDVSRDEAFRYLATEQAERVPGESYDEEATNEPGGETAVSRKSPRKSNRRNKTP